MLAGDNAIIVGLAASQVAPELRARVIFWGIVGAVVLRIAFAGITAQLLALTGLMLAVSIARTNTAPRHSAKPVRRPNR